MLSSALIVLMSFFIPAESEVYLSEGSVYAEYQQADVTFLIFDDDLAMQAQAEFRETLAKPETARAGVVVTSITEGEVAGRMTVAIDYAKPAAVAKLGADGKVIVVEGQERTRQTYFDLGAQHLVLTVWTKVDEVDLVAVSDEIVGLTIGGDGDTAKIPAFLIGGMPIEAFAETLTSDFLDAPLRVDVTSEE